MASIALKRSDEDSVSSGSGSNTNVHLCAEDLGYNDHHAPAPHGLYGSTLASLGYNQPHHNPRRGPAAFQRQDSLRSSNLGYGGDGDDYSLVGECDVSSIRSDKNRPGRRASLSAAIELTRETPKRVTSGSRPRGRRNSMFGNNSKASEADPNVPAQSFLTPARSKSGGSMLSKIGRRASMGSPAEALKGMQPAEPEPTPQFFHKRKGGGSPRRKGSYDKDDPRAQHLTSQLRPGEKIKRPKNNSRRASMSAVPFGGKGAVSGSNSGSASNYSSEDEDDILLINRVAPPRSSSYGNPRQQYLNRQHQNHRNHHQEVEVDEYGYEIDPQLPAPPPPSGPSKRALQNRRGSTGTALAALMGSSSARASLKESLHWKVGRRGSTASSVATSNVTDATDLASNQQSRPRYLDYHHHHQQQQQQQQQHDKQQKLPQRSDSPEPDLLGTPQSTPQQEGRRTVNLQGLPMISPSSSHSDKPTPVQSNRKTRDNLLLNMNNKHSQNHNASLSGTLGDSNALLDDLSLGMDSSGGSHNINDDDDDEDDDDGPRGRRSSTRTQRASLVRLDKQTPLGGAAIGGGPGARGSALGFNPYGRNKGFGNSESEDSEEEDEEEEEREANAREQKTEKESELQSEQAVEKAPEDAPPSSPNKQDEGESPEASTVSPPRPSHSEPSKKHETTNNLTADALAATAGTVTTEDDDEDEHSNGSMTSEVPEEGIPKVSMDDEEREAIEEIGATGDWSQGVQDYMYQTTQQTKKNSLLDRYPGSIDDNDILGYDYSHTTKDPMNAYDDESERKDEADISELYAEDYSDLTWRERQARAPESMEFINMEQLMSKAKNTKGLYLPTFIPAHGCANASDFIVRCFVARLRAGMLVTKHSRSRWSKSHDRILHILPTGYHITWIPETEEEAIAKSSKKPPTKLDLTKCLEVRHAWSRDPKATRYTGTHTLRSKCKEGAANRSFALIYPHRTVDFTAMTVDQCKILMEGFSALCFRLQMAKLEQQANDDDTHVTGVSGMDYDDDSTTASLTTTNMSAPWGL